MIHIVLPLLFCLTLTFACPDDQSETAFVIDDFSLAQPRLVTDKQELLASSSSAPGRVLFGYRGASLKTSNFGFGDKRSSVRVAQGRMNYLIHGGNTGSLQLTYDSGISAGFKGPVVDHVADLTSNGINNLVLVKMSSSSSLFITVTVYDNEGASEVITTRVPKIETLSAIKIRLSSLAYKSTSLEILIEPERVEDASTSVVIEQVSTGCGSNDGESSSVILSKQESQPQCPSVDLGTSVGTTGFVLAASSEARFTFQCAPAATGPQHSFQFRAPSTGVYSFGTSGFLDTVLEVRKGDCLTGALVDCNDDAIPLTVFTSNATSFLTADEVVFIIVGGYSTQDVGNSELKITFTPSTGAPVIAGCPQLEWPSNSASVTLDLESEPRQLIFGCSATALGPQKSVRFQAGQEGFYIFDTFNSSVLDTVLEVREDCAEAGRAVACNDDWDPSSVIFQSRVEVFLVPDQQVIIWVGGYATTDVGSVTIKYSFVSFSIPPSSTNTPAPTTNTGAPTASTSVPTASTSAPTTSTSAPTASTSAPTTSTSAPTASTSSPTISTSAPTTSTASPTTSTAAPTTSTPSPTTNTPPSTASPTSLPMPLSGSFSGSIMFRKQINVASAPCCSTVYEQTFQLDVTSSSLVINRAGAAGSCGPLAPGVLMISSLSSTSVPYCYTGDISVTLSDGNMFQVGPGVVFYDGSSFVTSILGSSLFPTCDFPNTLDLMCSGAGNSFFQPLVGLLSNDVSTVAPTSVSNAPTTQAPIGTSSAPTGAPTPIAPVLCCCLPQDGVGPCLRNVPPELCGFALGTCLDNPVTAGPTGAPSPNSSPTATPSPSPTSSPVSTPSPTTAPVITPAPSASPTTTGSPTTTTQVITPLPTTSPTPAPSTVAPTPGPTEPPTVERPKDCCCITSPDGVGCIWVNTALCEIANYQCRPPAPPAPTKAPTSSQPTYLNSRCCCLLYPNNPSDQRCVQDVLVTTCEARDPVTNFRSRCKD